MKRFLAFAIALALPCSAFAADGDAVVLKIKKPGVGEVGKETKTGEETMIMKGSAMGMSLDKDDKKSHVAEFTEEILAVDEKTKKSSKVTRVYTKAELTIGGEKKVLDLVGKTVLIEKKEKKYDFTIDGKPVDANTMIFLADDFKDKGNDDDAMDILLPKEAVKSGATWKIDLEKAVKGFGPGMDFDLAKSTGTGKLLKTYKKGDTVCGEIEFKMTLACTKLGEGAEKLNLKPGATLDITMTIDGCIDGTEASGKVNMTMKGTFDIDAPMVELKMTMDMKMVGSREPVKKK